ncbi:Rrf2 family transcriptional regulator [Mucilaginibacter sp. 14171R-50]|uniref:Rrf2 family transcriptional regulator n=1 Tax=Mucilaginibacter sp. 14171R-50 TaxID=2703789 RepID=UPI00138C65E9|nr:Rrf2 family transcriptional regulator [Mucilaginibacter sp. 14171R-50]QHS56703.1 Rrf2 family transcriptional regulator [Mucilaginibacter sp. 14171R-50]
MNGRFPIAMHIMTLLCKADGLLSSDYMAGSINVNPALVRKELSNLNKHQMVTSREGKNGGYSLSKPAREISLASIYKAVKPNQVLGQAKNEPNPACPVGKQINEHLNGLDNEIEQTMMNKLGTTNLAEFCKKFN